MTPLPILPEHHAAILRNNKAFVHWLSPLDALDLNALLEQADYARQFDDGDAILIGYDGNGPYRHKNVDWLSDRLGDYFYIDRVIIGASAQGQGYGRRLYADLEAFARDRGHSKIACEVNTLPDNPVSHAFHRSLGFEPIGEEHYAGRKSVRYYVRKL